MKKSKGRESWPSQRWWGKTVKKFSHKKNRQTTRQLLHHEKYDAIPQRKPADTEDPWGWD